MLVILTVEGWCELLLPVFFPLVTGAAQKMNILKLSGVRGPLPTRVSCSDMGEQYQAIRIISLASLQGWFNQYLRIHLTKA
jgi:hypothetical protein